MLATIEATPDSGDLSAAEQSVVNGAGEIAAAQCRWLLDLASLDGSGETKEFYSLASWLSWRCSMHIRTATEYVKVAGALSHLPRITECFSQGRLSYSQVKLLSRVASPETEEVLLNVALSGTVGQLAKVVGAYRGVLEAEADTESRQLRRGLTTWFDEDGFLVMRGRLAPEEGAVVEKALQRAMDSMKTDTACSAEPSPGDAFDTSAAGKADALSQLAREYLDAEVQDKRTATLPEVVVHVDLDSLIGHEGEGCHLDGGVALAPSTALRISCDSALIPLIEAADGRPLSVGRRTRSIPGGLRRALEARDGTCRFPGCTRKRYLHGHHVLHWAHGGETAIENLVLLCHFHHRLVHEGGYRVRRNGNEFEFFRPDGRLISPNPLSAKPAPSRELHSQIDVAPGAICSGWDGERMNLGYVVDVICLARGPDEGSRSVSALRGPVASDA